jgi:hypothetical protein
MAAKHFLKSLAAIPLCGLLAACALATPGMVGTPNGGVVQPYPWKSESQAAVFELADRYCRPYRKRAYLTQWSPEQGNTTFACVY